MKTTQQKTPKEVIERLIIKVENLENVICYLVACMSLELGHSTAKKIIDSVKNGQIDQ